MSNENEEVKRRGRPPKSEVSVVDALVEPETFTDEEIDRSARVMAEVTRRAKAAEDAKLSDADKAERAKYEEDKKNIKAKVLLGFDNPGWLARELKLTVRRTEYILREVLLEDHAEKNRAALKIPGIPS